MPSGVASSVEQVLHKFVIMGEPESGKSSFISKACSLTSEVKPTQYMDVNLYKCHDHNASIHLHELSLGRAYSELDSIFLSQANAILFFISLEGDFITQAAGSETLKAVPAAIENIDRLVRSMPAGCPAYIVISKIDHFDRFKFRIKDEVSGFLKRHFPVLEQCEYFPYSTENDEDGRRARSIVDWVECQVAQREACHGRARCLPVSPGNDLSEESIFLSLREIATATGFSSKYKLAFGEHGNQMSSASKDAAVKYFEIVINRCFIKIIHIKELRTLYCDLSKGLYFTKQSVDYAKVSDMLAIKIIDLKLSDLLIRLHRLRNSPDQPHGFTLGHCAEEFYFELLSTKHSSAASLFSKKSAAQQYLDKSIAVVKRPDDRERLREYFKPIESVGLTPSA